ncbi:serine hydrolase domain-containing protein [Actinoallomurus vinaceus]|uniref:Serine hydrolase domain-containing protein n=1 Tax=Actinoallomurus vinaceus TaxID=1080074 RepID=A0ABP8ULF6_9ACTN
MKKRASLAALALTAVVGAGLAPAASAAATAPLPPLKPDLLRAAISGLPNGTVTSAIVKVTGPAGRWQGTSGVGDVETGGPVPADGRFRIGSATKVFTAAVILQLAAERRIDLGQSVQHYLPGVLPASFPRITVRQILNHTSGLPDGTLGFGDAQWFVDHRLQSWTLAEIVADSVKNPMVFPPGTKQQYNGTNYFLAGMLVEKVTGRSYGDEVRRRIIRPLHLRDTYAPDRDDVRLPGPYAHGYVALTEDGKTTLHDVSEQSPWPSAEGGMISTTADLTRFVNALFRGRVVPRRQLTEMFTTPDVPYIDDKECNRGPAAGRACFSVGMTKVTMPNGVTIWGKTGSRPGYTSGMFATRDLRRTVVYSLTPTGNKDGSESPYVSKIAAATIDPDLLSGG